MKTAPVKLVSIFPFLCLFAGVAAPGGETPPGKEISVSLLSVMSETSWEPGIKKPERNFTVTLGFSTSDLRKIIGCREEKILLDIRDSSGGGEAASGYESDLDAENPQLKIKTGSWMPSAEARWVCVKGTVPLVIAEKEVMSGGALFSLEEKKEKQVLVLKGGSLTDDGRQTDVKAGLKMKWSLSEGSGKVNLSVELTSSCLLGIRGVTLMKTDGTPVLAENRGWGYSSGSDGSFSWEWDYSLDPGEKGKIQVFVNYMTELKQVNVPVEMKFGLSGMAR